MAANIAPLVTGWPTPSWFGALPAGPAYTQNYLLAEETTIKVGGPAQVLAVPNNWEDVVALRAFAEANHVPFTLLGKGSNMVVKDSGIAGLVVPLGKGCDVARIEDLDATGGVLYAEAGAATGTAARLARDAGLAGLAFFGGIPGSVGGALRMNAGAYGHETFNDIIELILLDAAGRTAVVLPGFVEPRYRGTSLPPGWLYKAARWRLTPGDKEAIRQQMREINEARRTSQPLAMPSSGSWFKNVLVTPENLATLQAIVPQATVGGVVNAWRVVSAAGCRGWQQGGAQVSEQHCNFFVNTGGATAADLDKLSIRVEQEIANRLGITIEREVRFTS